MYYLLIFLIILLYVLLQSQPERKKMKKENLYSFIICATIVLLAAFRADSVGADTKGYRDEYLAMGGYTSIQSIIDRHTIDYLGYYLTSKLFSMLGMPVQVWFGFIEAFYLFALMCLVKRFSRDIIFSLLVFTTIGLFSFSLAGLKQTFAMGLMMLAFLAFIEKRYLVTVLLIYVTYFTHQSVLIFLVAFPLYYVRKVRWLIWATIVLSVLIYYYNFLFMETMVDIIGNERWEKYLINESGYTSVTLIFYTVITLIAAFDNRKYNKAEPDFARFSLAMSILFGQCVTLFVQACLFIYTVHDDSSSKYSVLF